MQAWGNGDRVLIGYCGKRYMVDPRNTEKMYRDVLAPGISESNIKMASGTVACPGPGAPRLSLVLFTEFCVPLVFHCLCSLLTQTAPLILLLQCDQQPCALSSVMAYVIFSYHVLSPVTVWEIWHGAPVPLWSGSILVDICLFVCFLCLWGWEVKVVLCLH